MTRKLRIVYMGTPDFAVGPLRSIIDEGYDIVAVITAPDKPSGRGQKIQFSPVKRFALDTGIKILQPTNLKDEKFITDLKNLEANLQVVVAFRMLPEIVWQMPIYGTLNLHASLLPDYRGAAPINRAIMNGETETGVTTFFIEKEIDKGKILLTEKARILPSDNAETLHDRLMEIGSKTLTDTLRIIESGNFSAIEQSYFELGNQKLNLAPKIFKNDCMIIWDSTSIDIYNFIRGLSPFPGAFTNFIYNKGASRQVKVFKTTIIKAAATNSPGTLSTNNLNSLFVNTRDGVIQIDELQVEGKKRMTAIEFLRGTQLTDLDQFGNHYFE